MFDKGDATLKDASHKHMDISGRREIMVQEENVIPYKIKVLVTKDSGQNKLFVGLEDLKDIGILHREFPKTLPDKRREDAKQFNAQYTSIRGDQGNEKMEVKEKRERARGVLLYPEERYEQVVEKITNFDSFPEEIKVILDKYIDECGASTAEREGGVQTLCVLLVLADTSALQRDGEEGGAGQGSRKMGTVGTCSQPICDFGSHFWLAS